MSRIALLLLCFWVAPAARAEVHDRGLDGLLDAVDPPDDALPSLERVVRVVVARGVRVTLESGGLIELRAGGDVLARGPGPVELSVEGGAVRVGSRVVPAVEVSAPAGWRIDAHEGGSHVVVSSFEGKLLVAEHVPLETYVASVVGAEMSSSWPAAALEAQAVAARTYVLRKLGQVPAGRPFDVENSVVHQAFKGRASTDERSLAAAAATAGRVLVADGALAEAYFHALSVGRTESAAAAFGSGPAYLSPVACEAPAEVPHASWERRFELPDLSAKLLSAGVIGDALARLEVVSRSSTGRLSSVRLVTKRGGVRVVPAAELRRWLGWDAVPSLDASITSNDGAVTIRGRGRGHGVGLCQWCAKSMAEGGASGTEILAHFYPGTSVVDSASVGIDPFAVLREPGR